MSAVMSEQTGSNVAEFFSPGPGERLRAARLSMGYDLGKLASELHLTKTTVELLEADDYEDIGARVFVRGYLRNYARIVGMPVDSILRQFDDKWPEEAPAQTFVRQSPTLPADGGPGRGLAGMVTWLLIIGTVVLFLVWWRGYLDAIVPEPIRSGVADAPMAAEPGEGIAGDGAAASIDAVPADGSLLLPPLPDTPETRAIPAAPTSDSSNDAAPNDSMSLLLAPPAVDATVAGDAEAVGASAPAVSSGESPVAASPLPVAGDATATTDGVTPAGLPPQVVMTFTAPCWVDVRDSERRFKLFGEMPKGERKVLGGTPPYKVVIGNAKAVEITIDGEPFDIMQYAKGNVARFTLNP